jgi:hypothetical protein
MQLWCRPTRKNAEFRTVLAIDASKGFRFVIQSPSCHCYIAVKRFVNEFDTYSEILDVRNGELCQCVNPGFRGVNLRSRRLRWPQFSNARWWRNTEAGGLR